MSRTGKNSAQRRKALSEKKTVCTSYLRSIKLISTLLMPVLFYFCWTYWYAAKMKEGYLWRGNLAVSALYGIILLLLVRIYRGYDVGKLEWQELFVSHCLSQSICNFIFYALSFFLCERLVSPLPLAALQAAEMLLALVLLRTEERVFRHFSEKEQMLLLYRTEEDLSRLTNLSDFLDRFSIIGELSVSAYTKELAANVSEADCVLIVGVDAGVRNGVLKDCIEEGIPAYVMPKTGDILLRGAQLDLVSGELLFRTARSALTPEYRLVKRMFDIFASLVGLVVLSPVMLVTALAIKLEDGGPVFYRQTRLTKDRQEFRILKFRSMRVDAEKDGKARLAGEHDERITRVGRLIRACRIDELPQLINILGGSMTVVGPRPERPEIAAQYEEFLPAFSLRLQVKAGLTGYAQIYGRYNSEPYEKLQMDLMYINNMSVTEDLKLMFATARILFVKESTSGITDGQVTAARQEERHDTVLSK